MDRLPWSRWHWLVVFALGITWVLDGLERVATPLSARSAVPSDQARPPRPVPPPP